MSMNKRNFVAAGMGLAGLWTATGNSHAATQAKAPSGHTLLTISGAITQSNRGALDATIDQMMGKHGIQFDNAYALDAAALTRMPAITIKPTLEYDSKPHRLKGPCSPPCWPMPVWPLAAPCNWACARWTATTSTSAWPTPRPTA